MDWIRNNPALFNSFAIGLTVAIVTFLVALGVPVSPEVSAALVSLVTMIGAIIIGIITKGQVVPFQNVLEYRKIESDGRLSAEVIAGPANDLTTIGKRVRAVGEPAYTPDANE